MLLILDNDIADLKFDELEVNSALENLFGSYFVGAHMIVADRPLLDRLAKENALSLRAKAAARNILNRLPELGALPSKLGWRIHVSGTAAEVCVTDSLCLMPIGAFSHPTLTNPTALLGENLIDVRFFKLAADHFRISTRMNGLRVSCSSVQGGGSTTGQALANEDRFCLCVVDSDRSAPQDALGATAKACRDVVGGV